MSSKPKSADYQPGEDAKAAASVALAEYNRFKTKFDPLLREMRDRDVSDEVGSIVRGRANADAMQTLTDPENLSLQSLGNADIEGAVGEGLTGNLQQATEQVQTAENEQDLGVLSAARGQAATAQSGLSQAARLESNERLQEARRKQSSAQTLIDAGVKLGTAVLGSGIRNKMGGGDFFTPNASTVEGEFSAPSLEERFSIGIGRL